MLAAHHISACVSLLGVHEKKPHLLLQLGLQLLDAAVGCVQLLAQVLCELQVVVQRCGGLVQLGLQCECGSTATEGLLG